MTIMVIVTVGMIVLLTMSVILAMIIVLVGAVLRIECRFNGDSRAPKPRSMSSIT